MASLSEKRMQFIVQFTRMDLDTLDADGWQNLRGNLEDFLLTVGPEERIPTTISIENLFPLDILARERSQDGIVTVPADNKSYLSEPVDVIKLLQMKTRDILLDIVAARAPQSDPQSWPKLSAYFAISKQPKNVSQDAPRVPTLFLLAELEDTFILRLLLKLWGESTDRIQTCPECGSLFYRIRKQKYCSRPCANRVSVRKFRATEKGKRQERERARIRYRKNKAPARVHPKGSIKES